MTDHIGPYELRGELGRGAMAVVWRAWEPSLRREVALKEAHIPHGTSPTVAGELAERFVREARAVAGLSHPNIVTVFSSDVYDGRPVIAMEVIEGDTLSSLLDHGPLPASAALAILDQLLDAVGYAHSKDVVHRDIKPDNVFVTSGGRVKLTDFGIAHVGSGTALTQAGTVMGTPGYMAPEQVTGQQVDVRADLFAIGVLGYEMLTGSNPFTAGDAHPTTVMYRVLNEELPDVRRSVRDASESVAVLLAVATQKDPANRFPSADAMRATLRGDAIVAMPRPTAPASTRRSMRTRYLVSGGVSVLVLVLVGFWFFGPSAPRGGVSALGATSSISPTETTALGSGSTAADQAAVKDAIDLIQPQIAKASASFFSEDILTGEGHDMSIATVSNAMVDEGVVNRSRDRAQAATSDPDSKSASDSIARCASEIIAYNSALSNGDAAIAVRSLAAARYYLWEARQLALGEARRSKAVGSIRAKAAQLPAGMDLWMLAEEDGGDPVFNANESAIYDMSWSYVTDVDVVGLKGSDPTIQDIQDPSMGDATVQGAGVIAFFSTGNHADSVTFFDPRHAGLDGVPGDSGGFSYMIVGPMLGSEGYSSVMSKSLVVLPHP